MSCDGALCEDLVGEDQLHPGDVVRTHHHLHTQCLISNHYEYR
jgi:hypothetical protein